MLQLDLSYMRIRYLFFVSSAVICGWIFQSSVVRAATCSITTDTVVDQTYVTNNGCDDIDISGSSVSTTWIGTVALPGSGTVRIVSGTTSFGTGSVMTLGGNNNFVVEAPATLTHVANGPSGIQITAKNITITGAINASGKGCSGNTSNVGYGPDPSTGVCTLGASGAGQSQYGGAGHGGVGGTYFSPAGATYGSLTSPILPGSSGGGQGNGGGFGGGRIFLNISGVLTVNGTIAANASVGASYQGGGSGGSVYIRAATFAGSGTISSNGAAGTDFGSPGGGGRIALRYSSVSFSGTSSTTKGSGGGNDNAADGTIYVLVLNQPPSTPSSLGQAGLVNGSTTGTNNPLYTFTLADPDVSDTVQYRIQIDDTADFSSPVVDYTSALAAQGARTFQVGQSAGGGTYSVGSSGQTLSNGSYYWRVQAIDAAAAASSYATANGGAIAFVMDTAPRYLRFANSSASGLESVTATSVRIFLNTAHFETVTVAYSVTGGTATGGGTDYTLASGTATITAGDTSTTIPLTIINDQIDEPDETIILTLSAPTYATIGSNTSTTYTITDNDTAGVTIVESSGSTNVTEGGATDSFTVVLTSAPTSTVRVSFATSTYGVTLDQDHVDFTSGNWNVPQTVTVTATNDSVAEGSHTSPIAFSVSVPSDFAYGYSISPPVISSITVAITDNDTAGVTVSASSLSLAEGGSSGSYTMVLVSAPTTAVTIIPSVSGLASVSPASFSFTSLTGTSLKRSR